MSSDEEKAYSSRKIAIMFFSVLLRLGSLHLSALCGWKGCALLQALLVLGSEGYRVSMLQNNFEISMHALHLICIGKLRIYRAGHLISFPCRYMTRVKSKNKDSVRYCLSMSSCKLDRVRLGER